MAEYVLDARYMLCPLPVLRARKVIDTLDPGDQLIIEGTDPDGIKEFELFCQERPDVKILHSDQTETGWKIRLQFRGPFDD
ncbi:MAG: sulfurtransferase TusA family protein [Pseudomonadota bacterium]